MSRVFRGLLVLVVTLVVALPALAGEGRTPIWQQTVIANAGKYIVTRNISGPGPIIDIQSPDVDVDLNGFVLQGGPGAPVIRVGPMNNVAIRNGTLSGGDLGILANGGGPGITYKLIVEDVRILYAMQRGISIQFTSDFALRRNNVVLAGREAIYVDGVAQPRVQGTIEHNRILHCGGGIWVRWGSSVGILNNRLENLNLTPSPAPPAQGAIVYDYADAGLIAENTVENVLDTTGGVGGNGIYLGDASGCKVHNNVVRGGSTDGIAIAGMSDDNLILENVATMNRRDGLRVEGSRNHVDRNVLNRNCSGAGIGNCWGLHFPAQWGGSGNTFGRNTARGNGGFAGMCPWGGIGNPPTSDFCDEQLPGPAGPNSSFNDNYMPILF